MKLTCFFFLALNFSIYGQIDTNYVELISRDRTVQYHATSQDFSVKVSGFSEDAAEFRINNLSTGFYFKFGLAELFVSLPLLNINNQTFGATKSFGTGFSLNYYGRKLHFNYDFKYAQGYESFSQVLSDGLQTLSKNNYFFFNRLNTHYVLNPDRFSLSAALRFNNRQKKSAGSWILGTPISYHFATLGSQEDIYLERYALGVMGGYAYSYVNGSWSTSVIAKAGADFRYSSFGTFSDLALRPSANFILSSVYNVGRYFVGVTYNFYPEYDYGQEFSMQVTNWKLRLYVGRRFID